MLDLRRHIHKECPWDMSLAPKGHGYFDKESFQAWWNRASDRLKHLSPEICEQWIYKHWEMSPMKFIPLEGLSWHEDIWRPQAFIENVKTWYGEELHPQFDYDTFHQYPGNVTSSTLDAGRWEYAPVVLSTPGGFIDSYGNSIEAEFLLVEGHQRRRYLNALLCRGVNLEPQRVLVLDDWPK